MLHETWICFRVFNGKMLVEKLKELVWRDAVSKDLIRVLSLHEGMHQMASHGALGLVRWPAPVARQRTGTSRSRYRLVCDDRS